MAISPAALEKSQQVLGYHFQDPSLLEQAFTHASLADNRTQSNERLEFLGDAVLGLIICHELYRRFPDYLEGELTKIKSMIVSRRTCARLADQLGLSEFLCVGKGMATQKRVPASCRGAVLEAVIGAIYIDGGEKAAWDFVVRIAKDLLDQADAEQHQENFKSILQQYAQRHLDATPIYEVLDEKGPDHSKCFEVGVVIRDQRFASAWGPSKKQAEQIAAHRALIELDLIPPDTPLPVAGSF